MDPSSAASPSAAAPSPPRPRTTVLVWYHAFDLRMHDHAPIAAAAGWTEAFLAAHPQITQQGQGRKEGDVHGAAGRGSGDSALPHPSAHAHVLPVFIFDVERWFNRVSLAAILDGPSKTMSREREAGVKPTRPLSDDQSDVTDEAIPHPNDDSPAEEKEATAAAAANSNSRYKASAYLSSQWTLDHTTLMKTDVKRASFLLECVADLQSNLRAIGSDLLIRVGKTEEVLEQLMRDADVASLYTHIDYAEEELVVSRLVAAACARHSVRMRLFEGNTLYLPADLPWSLDKVPDVFTPFRTRVEQMGPAAVRSTLPYSLAVRPEDLVDAASASAEQRALLCAQAVPEGFKMKPVPASFAAERTKRSLPTFESLGYSARAIRRFTESSPEAQAHAAHSNFPMRGGETAAIRHMMEYIWGKLRDEQTAAATIAAAAAAAVAAAPVAASSSSASADASTAASTAEPSSSVAAPVPASAVVGGPISHYKDTRNSLNGLNYSSKFSPFLSAGCLSARRIHEQVQAFERLVLRNPSTTWLQVELLFRDHFRFLADKYGPKVFWKYGPNPRNWSRSHKDQLEWRTDVRLLRAWCLGQTGYPFIDACMRELLFTGYMSNRGRQVAASFLLHDLKLDWRLGAAWFESQLIDHDIASNYGNWTYQAGVAFDPRSPYRYFNIRKQESMYDPTHSHRKLWLPELFTNAEATAENKEELTSAAASSQVAPSSAVTASSEEHKESEFPSPAHSPASAAAAALPTSSFPSSYPKPIVPLQSDHAGGAAHSASGGGGDNSAKGAASSANAKAGAESTAAGAAHAQHHPHRRGGERQSGGSHGGSGGRDGGGGGRNSGSGGGQGRSGGGRGGDDRGGHGGRAPQLQHGGRGAPRGVVPSAVPVSAPPPLVSLAPSLGFVGGIRYVAYAPSPAPYILGHTAHNPAAMAFGGMQTMIGGGGVPMPAMIGFHPNQPGPYNRNLSGVGSGSFPRGGGGGRAGYQGPHGPRPPRGQLVSNNPYSTS